MDTRYLEIELEKQAAPWLAPDLPWPRLARNEIHIWRASLDLHSWHVDELTQLLSDDELAKVTRFHFERHRRRLIVARGTLRVMLGHYAGVEPGQLRFTYGPHGKPHLADPIQGRDLQFNLAHSQELALYAFARRRQIGVDLEFVRSIPDFDQNGFRLFSDREKEVFHALPEDQRLTAFFTCWTRKEAYIKARGDGLSIPLGKIEVSLTPSEPATLLAVEADVEKSSQWSLRDLAPGPGYVGALAAEGTDWQTACWQYSPLNQARR